MSESTSCQLPIEAATDEAQAAARLGEAAREAFLQVANAAEVMAAHLNTIVSIGARMEPVLRQIQEISDGAGDE